MVPEPWAVEIKKPSGPARILRSWNILKNFMINFIVIVILILFEVDDDSEKIVFI